MKLTKFKQQFYRPDVDQMALLSTTNVLLPPPISQIDPTLPEAVITVLSKVPAYHRSMSVRLPDLEFVMTTLRTNQLPPPPQQQPQSRGVKRAAEQEEQEDENDEDDSSHGGVNRPPQNDIYRKRRAQKLQKTQ
jgi:hypothetical protein